MAQVWRFFLVATSAMGVGTLCIPVDLWICGYLAMGTLFLVGSPVSLTKTLRDNHEAPRVSQVIRDARLERILAEQDLLTGRRGDEGGRRRLGRRDRRCARRHRPRPYVDSPVQTEASSGRSPDRWARTLRSRRFP